MFLATGRKYAKMMFRAAISPHSLSSIVYETWEALCICLKKYIEVSANLFAFYKLFKSWSIVKHRFFVLFTIISKIKFLKVKCNTVYVKRK